MNIFEVHAPGKRTFDRVFRVSDGMRKDLGVASR